MCFKGACSQTSAGHFEGEKKSKYAYSAKTNAPYIQLLILWMFCNKIVCVRAYLCVSLGFFCLLAVSWKGRGLFLSELIRGSRLYPSLITLLRANIPFYFFSLSLIVTLCCWWTGKRFSNLSTVSLFLVLHLLAFLPFSLSLPLKLNAEVTSVSRCAATDSSTFSIFFCRFVCLCMLSPQAIHKEITLPK